MSIAADSSRPNTAQATADVALATEPGVLPLDSRSRTSTPPKVESANDDPELQLQRDVRPKSGLHWATAIWLGVVHVGLLAAPFTFTWTGLAVAAFLAWFTGSIGICLCFHRLLTHRSFKTHRVTRIVLAWIGGLAGEGSAIHWVANHRKHHAYSDQPGDPHSPREGTWWSHAHWLMWARPGKTYDEYNRRWAPDLADDRALRFLDKTFLLWHLLMGLGLYLAGTAWAGPAMGTSLVVWGMFVRLAWVLHSTWFVNSASHIWGYRTYETTDDSRNNWWVALLTFGEGWHNNHHAFPTMARAGHRWWEIDVTFWAIRAFQACGLFWDVVDGHHQKESGRKKRLAA